MDRFKADLDNFEKQLSQANEETRVAWEYLESLNLEMAEGDNGIVVLASMLKIAAAAEREACAAICYEIIERLHSVVFSGEVSGAIMQGRIAMANEIAAAIRARGEGEEG
ncbi:MAG: hypothetical protein ACYTBJ_25325 [Planctomycetota bacterium]|jgi:hypothetical protein